MVGYFRRKLINASVFDGFAVDEKTGVFCFFHRLVFVLNRIKVVLVLIKQKTLILLSGCSDNGDLYKDYCYISN